MEAIAIVLILAIVIEAIVQVIKGWVPESAKVPGWVWPITSAVLGVALCLLAGVDLLAIAGVTLAVPIVGQVLTGVIISRGASFVHDLWSKIKGDKDAAQVAAGVPEKPPDTETN